MTKTTLTALDKEKEQLYEQYSSPEFKSKSAEEQMNIIDCLYAVQHLLYIYHRKELN